MLPLQEFVRFIEENKLFAPQDHLLLAVSGGKDSVLMAQLFKLAGYHFSIAHCNFNLRGDEAQRDEMFVKLLASDLQVPFHVIHFDTKRFADENGLSTQMAARELRYAWFEETRKTYGYQYIALAQHQNDSIETLLLNLVRGTGISGMHGILPKRGLLVRPLLFLTRQQIDDFVDQNNMDYVEDSSNLTHKYARNKIRLEVIPRLKEINPNLETTFAENIRRFAETEALLQEVVGNIRAKIFKWVDTDLQIDKAVIKDLKPQKLLCFELLKPYSFTDKVVDEILNALGKQSGTSFYSHSHRLTIDRNKVIISALPFKEPEIGELHQEGEVQLAYGHKVSMRFSNNLSFIGAGHLAYVDEAKLIFPLVIRFWQDGDRFKPLGMNYFKKLSDFFIDQKIPLPQKQRIPLLVNGNGEIIWIAGLRQDERYKVGATTKKVAIFELSNHHG